MLVEQRTYTTHPGQWRNYLALYEAEGWPCSSASLAAWWATTPRSRGR